MSLFADLARLSPEHAVLWFSFNFVAAYLIAKYARPARGTRFDGAD